MATITKKIEFRRMSPVPAIEEHINRQLAKIEKFLQTKRSPIVIDVILEKHPDHAHDSASICITVPIHATTIDIVVRREGPDLYTCIDEVTERAYRDLLEAKEKLVDFEKHGK